jgi:23S rRNA G2445 N2-methylase RlmL
MCILASMSRSRSLETYRLTMAPGFERAVGRAVESDVESVVVVAQAPGSITLHGPSEAATPLAKLPYASMVLRELGRTDEERLDDAAVSLAAQLASRAVSKNLDLRRGFRIRVSDVGALVPIDAAVRRALERAVTCWSGAQPSARGGGLEVWVVRRRMDRHVTLSVRLDRGPVEKAGRGELKRDLAAALVRTVPLRRDDVYFDPFAGSGAIARARGPRKVSRWRRALASWSTGARHVSLSPTPDRGLALGGQARLFAASTPRSSREGPLRSGLRPATR